MSGPEPAPTPDSAPTPGAAVTPAKLTVHVLDVAAGRPAANLAYTLVRLDPDPAELASGHTNADGRTDQPLADHTTFGPGTYELTYDLGAYFAPAPTLFDRYPIRFRVTDAEPYHVALIATPWSATVYRGS